MNDLIRNSNNNNNNNNSNSNSNNNKNNSNNSNDNKDDGIGRDTCDAQSNCPKQRKEEIK